MTMAISPMSSVAIKPEQCPDFIASFEDNNWRLYRLQERMLTSISIYEEEMTVITI